MPSHVSPRALVDALRDILYPPRPAEDFDFVSHVRQLTRSRSISDNITQHRTAFAEAAVHLYNLAAAKRGEAAVKAAVEGLLQLGRPGWLLVRRLLLRQTLAPETCKALLDNLPARCGLGLCQELFRPPAAPEKSLLPWAETLLHTLCQADVNELLAFVQEVDATHDIISHAVREALLAGPLDAWIVGKLADQLDLERFTSLCSCARALVRPDIAATLAGQLARGNGPVTPATIPLLVQAAAPGDSKVLAALQGLVKSAQPEVVLACIAGLAKLQWSNTGKLAALLHSKSDTLQKSIPLLAAHFPETVYRYYMAAIHESVRPRVYFAIFRCAARLQPTFAAARLKSGVELDATARQHFKTLINNEKKAALAGLRLNTPPKVRTEPLRPETNKGFLSRLLPGKKSSLSELFDQVHNPRDKALPGSELQETALTGRNLVNLDLSGSYFYKVQFIRSTFSGVDFSETTLSQVDITGCTFTNCRFRGAHLHTTALLSCTFSRCDFTETAFTDCSTEEVTFERSILTNCLLSRCRFDISRFRGCAIGGCQFREGQSRSLQFQNTSLSNNIWVNVNLSGIFWHHCTFAHETFLNARFQSSTMTDSCAAHCRILGSTTGIGILDLDECQRRSRLSLEMAIQTLKASPPETLTPSASEATFIRRGADLWIRHNDVMNREAHMRLINQKRLRWAEESMQGADFFRLIPYLLSSQVFEKAHKLPETPNCRIAGYVPSLDTLTVAEQHFPGLHSSAPAGEALVIESLATIGSVGSVAQTRDSDADFWVCYDAATATPAALQRLKIKLDALETWADQTFGLEAHFFLMSLENIQNNNFGFSDKESSGTSQALMLKEEFYRTALILAGRIPGWWLTPPGTEEKSYRAYLRAAVADPLADPGRFMDAGHASRIPAEEFFGAALWQIVKSIDSPFKSVLKLGLLEKYAKDGGKGMLLCDQIKQNVTFCVGSNCQTDPYAAMSALVRNHYRKTGDREAVSLLTESLALKADIASMPRLLDRPFAQEHQNLLAFLYGGDGNSVPSSGRTERSFARALALGTAVSRFMTTAYKRIRSAPQSNAAVASISPEDLTRLGRRIATIFSNKKSKIRRVPILGIGRGHFAELRFSADKSPGKPACWIVQGKAGRRGVVTTRKSEILTKSEDPAAMLCWLVINSVYTSTALVDADRSIAPLSTPDIRNILEEISTFFPPTHIFAVNPDEFLRDEQIVKILLLPNILAAPEVDKLVSLSVIYCTNWGEIFCLAPPSPAAILKFGSQAYLKKVLPQPQIQFPEIKAYYPKRSQCPRIKLA